jgi:hypothetical protein
MKEHLSYVAQQHPDHEGNGDDGGPGDSGEGFFHVWSSLGFAEFGSFDF